MKSNKFIKKAGILFAVLFMFTLIFAGKKQPSDSSNIDVLKVALYSNDEDHNDMFIKRKDTRVLITVNTDSLNSSNIDEMIVLSDDRSDPSENPGNPSAFTSWVDKNQKIYWSGVPKDENSTDVINILEIYRKTDGGAEILDKTFKDPDKNGVVVGKIKNKKVEGLEYYNIKFMINNDTTKVYDIDPKLRMTNAE